MKHICICVLTLLLLMSFIPVCESRTEIIDKGTNDVWAVWVGVVVVPVGMIGSRHL